jgi:hypothetical protein
VRRKLGFFSTPYSELFAIAVGAFADKDFPAPHYSVWEGRKYPWVEI